MKFPLSLVNRKQTASIRISGWTFTIALFWLMLTAANPSAQAQTSDDVSNSTTNTTASPGDWTQFLRDNMQRWNPDETVLNNVTVRSLTLKWKTTIGTTGGASSTAVVKGVVYLGSGADVYALNASTGAKLWSFQTGGNVNSSPAVVNGAVYFGSDDFNVYALNASTGAKLWSFATGAGVDSSPAVTNGVVYIGSGDHNVYALNASTGALLWKYATGFVIDASPAVVNGVVYIGSDDGTVYALNASTGAKLWSFNTGANQGTDLSPPVVANGVVYIGVILGGVYALNASTGAKLWNAVITRLSQFSPQ